MKLTQIELEQKYEFWKLDKIQQIKVYINYFVREEIPDIKRYQCCPKAYQTEFKKNCIKLFNLFKERADLNQLLNHSSKIIAFFIVYISSGVSHIGLTTVDMEKCLFHPTNYTNKQKILDYLLNEIDLLDWYKQTLEYKEWLDMQEKKQKYPNYYWGRSPDETEKEKALRIHKLNKARMAKLATSNYSQDKILSGLK